jgi:DNA-binding response OmpR family regulator
MARILVVDDDANLLTALKRDLDAEGYQVHAVVDGEAAINSAFQSSYDLIILDLGLPKVSGFDVCRRLRKNGLKTPILILSQKSDETDEIVALDSGADHYVTKPFRRGELLARVRAILRRVGGGRLPAIKLGAVEVDLAVGEVRRGGQKKALTSKEIKILTALYNDGDPCIFSRKQLLDAISGAYDAVTERSIDQHILNLRRAIEKNPSKPIYIKSARGTGYLLAIPNQKLTET